MIEIDTLSFEDQRWHNFLQKFEYAGPFSSPELIKSFSLSRGFEVFPLFAICNDTIVAAAFPVLIKTWKNISFRYLNRLILFEAPLYLNNSIGISGLCKILSSVITITKKKALFCEIRNNYPFQLDNILNEFDFIYYPYQNYLIDLQVGEDVLWSRLSSFTRNHIRKSQKKGVFVRELEENELHDAIKLLKKLYKQKKFLLLMKQFFLILTKI
ncbi:MAG: aminoacyltransferase [Patescibacteria group bacterium]|nr:aminoacyltransferase [Patescibacteria group bacterium]